jgi:hypothetical protein
MIMVASRNLGSGFRKIRPATADFAFIWGKTTAANTRAAHNDTAIRLGRTVWFFIR